MSRPGGNLSNGHVRPDGSCQIFTTKPGGVVHIIKSVKGPKTSWCGMRTSHRNPSMKIIHAGQVRPILDDGKFCQHCFEYRQTVIQGEFDKLIKLAYL